MIGKASCYRARTAPSPLLQIAANWNLDGVHDLTTTSLSQQFAFQSLDGVTSGQHTQHWQNLRFYVLELVGVQTEMHASTAMRNAHRQRDRL